MQGLIKDNSSENCLFNFRMQIDTCGKTPVCYQEKNTATYFNVLIESWHYMNTVHHSKSVCYSFSRSYYEGVTLKDCDLEEVPGEGDQSIIGTGKHLL